MSTLEEINCIFKKWEKFLEYAPEEVPADTPKYVPTPKTAGPKPLSIEEYRSRQEKKKKEEKKLEENKQKKKRGGRKRQFQRKCADLQRIINLSSGDQKRRLIGELKDLKKNGWQDFQGGDYKQCSSSICSINIIDNNNNTSRR